MKLSQKATKQYVRALLDEQGKPVRVQASAPKLVARVQRFRQSVSDPAFQRGVARSLKSLEPSDKAAVKKELESLRAWASELVDTMRS